MTTTFGPYTPVRQAGNLIFVSGQVGIDPVSKVASADMTEQAKQTLCNLAAVLADNGMTMQDVVKTTVFITDMDYFSAMNEVYEQAFSTPRPARSAVAVRELPRVAGNTKLLVEIEAVAYKEAVV